MLLLVAGATVAVDQATKEIVSRTLPLYKSIEVVQGWFSLTHIRNRGGAFGLLAEGGSGLQTFFFAAVSVLALGIILLLYGRVGSGKLWITLALALVFGGALGNLIDRLRFGEVVDFLDFYVGAAHWPAFNVADSAISVGAGILFLGALLRKI